MVKLLEPAVFLGALETIYALAFGHSAILAGASPKVFVIGAIPTRGASVNNMDCCISCKMIIG